MGARGRRARRSTTAPRRDHGGRRPRARGRRARRPPRPVGAPHGRGPAVRAGRRPTSLVATAAAAAQRRAGGDGHRRGDRPAPAPRRRSSPRSPTSARSPTPPTRSTRRSRCSPPPTPRASSSTEVDRGRAGRARAARLRRAAPALRHADPRHPAPARRARRSRCPRRSRPTVGSTPSARRRLAGVTTTTDDLTAADVAWDLEPLVDGRGADGVDAMLDDADAARVRARRCTGASSPSSTRRRSPAVMHEVAAVSRDRRAGRLVRRSAVRRRHVRPRARRAARPRRGAVDRDRQRAALPRARVGRAPRRARRARCSGPTSSTFCRHYLAPARRYRPHLLTEPEERILAEKAVTGRSAWARLFSELTSAITVDLDGGTVVARAGPLAAAVARPRRARSRGGRGDRPRSRPGCARARSCSTRCSPTRRPTTGCATTTAGSRAATSPTRRATSRCRRWSTPSVRPLRHPAALVRAQGPAPRPRPPRRLRPHGVGRGRAKRSSAGRGAASSCSTRTRRSRPSSPTSASRFFDEPWIDAPVRPGKRPGAFCAYTVPSHHPYLLLNWTARTARRAHARARARPRPARVPGPRPGRLPPDDAAHAGRDGVGVRRDGHVRPPARRDLAIPTTGSRCWPRASRARSPRCSARSR